MDATPKVCNATTLRNGCTGQCDHWPDPSTAYTHHDRLATNRSSKDADKGLE